MSCICAQTQAAAKRDGNAASLVTERLPRLVFPSFRAEAESAVRAAPWGRAAQSRSSFSPSHPVRYIRNCQVVR
jgi:hypothetical protein